MILNRLTDRGTVSDNNRSTLISWVGDTAKDTWDGAKNLASSAGEAISDGLDAINPMNWAW